MESHYDVDFRLAAFFLQVIDQEDQGSDSHDEHVHERDVFGVIKSICKDARGGYQHPCCQQPPPGIMKEPMAQRIKMIKPARNIRKRANWRT